MLEKTLLGSLSVLSQQKRKPMLFTEKARINMNITLDANHSLWLSDSKEPTTLAKFSLVFMKQDEERKTQPAREGGRRNIWKRFVWSLPETDLATTRAAGWPLE